MDHASCGLALAVTILLTLPIGVQEAVAAQTDRPAWAQAMANVHARFRGRPGTLYFGDSITESRGFWTPLKYVRKDAPPPEMEQAFQACRHTCDPNAGESGKGPTSAIKGQTAGWADQNVTAWLGNSTPRSP